LTRYRTQRITSNSWHYTNGGILAKVVPQRHYASKWDEEEQRKQITRANQTPQDDVELFISEQNWDELDERVKAEVRKMRVKKIDREVDFFLAERILAWS
jgi:hypothetical protein